MMKKLWSIVIPTIWSNKRCRRDFSRINDLRVKPSIRRLSICKSTLHPRSFSKATVLRGSILPNLKASRLGLYNKTIERSHLLQREVLRRERSLPNRKDTLPKLNSIWSNKSKASLKRSRGFPHWCLPRSKVAGKLITQAGKPLSK